MGNLFLVYNQMEYTYEDVLADLNQIDHKNDYVFVEKNDPYLLFLKIIHSLVYDYPIEIVDGDFSETEFQQLGIDLTELTTSDRIKDRFELLDITEVFDRIEEKKNWRLTLYTSGTTGKPKKVSHTYQHFTRNVRKKLKFKEDRWAFAYNPTHMAGLQVFFQALLNQNPIIYMFGESFEKLPKLFKKHHITSISATPTFYRNVLPYLKGNIYPFVKQLTFGGEKYDSSLEILLRSIFPNAKMQNVYASTETGSLFSTSGDIFEVKDELKNLVQITEQKELLIHRSLLGESQLLKVQNDWYFTGDLVEVIDETKFKFISRHSDLINMGGYKVNPLEVEAVLSKVPGVKDLVVKGRKNSVTGEILVADVVKNTELDGKELKKTIKQFAEEHLQEWKIPRIIKFVDELSITRTGKKLR